MEKLDFHKMLKKYADLIVQVGLNLQSGQRLLITNTKSSNNGVSIQAAPLVREVVASAYEAGARYVQVLWDDDLVQRIRFQKAPGDSFDEYPSWRAKAEEEYASRGDAMLVIVADNPDLLSDQDPERVAAAQQTARVHLRRVSEYTSRNATNWLIVAAAASGWAAKVYPDASPEERLDRLWRTIFAICRLDRDDPVETWRTHTENLAARCEYLNLKAYSALRLIAPGTDLTIGLPPGHFWEGGGTTTERGLPFIPNLPTEEVFTLPHRKVAEGIVRSSMPLNYGGALIEDFSLTFAEGRVTAVSARRGEKLLNKLIETDEGASHLGEIALVPNSSPISQSGLLFYNTLFDENAACHLALGRGFRMNLRDGGQMSQDEFRMAGGNTSLAHVDFMIGSGEMDVDGIMDGGGIEPVMRDGEWAFKV
jgi:aminopeptidase